MEGQLPIAITVFDKDYARKGVVAAPLSVNVMLQWNAPGVASFRLDADHRRVNDLVAPGARCVISYRAPGITEHILLSGLVSEAKGSGGPLSPVREFVVLDDLNVLNEIIGYPVPGSPLSAQSAAGYDTRTGPLETVLKGYVSANVTGQAIPRLTVQSSSGAGPTTTEKIRMHQLGEKLLPLATAAGLGVRVVQTGTTRQLQTWTPTTRPRVLTEASGIVQSAEFAYLPPEVTRIVVGIGGEDVARQFFGPPTTGYVDAAAEALWGIRRQEFIDARDIAQDDANKAAMALQRAQERLAEGASKASLKAELAETGAFRYGAAYRLGDLVSVQPAGAAVITERVREIEFEWDDDGLTITPRVGEWQDSMADKHWKAVRLALRATNELGAR